MNAHEGRHAVLRRCAILIAALLAHGVFACERGPDSAGALSPRGTSVFLIVLDAASAAYPRRLPSAWWQS